MSEIKRGDIVRLKSGGLYMTVQRDDLEYGLVSCQWFEDGVKLKEGEFSPESLEKVTEAEAESK